MSSYAAQRTKSSASAEVTALCRVAATTVRTWTSPRTKSSSLVYIRNLRIVDSRRLAESRKQCSIFPGPRARMSWSTRTPIWSSSTAVRRKCLVPASFVSGNAGQSEKASRPFGLPRVRYSAQSSPTKSPVLRPGVVPNDPSGCRQSRTGGCIAWRRACLGHRAPRVKERSRRAAQPTDVPGRIRPGVRCSQKVSNAGSFSSPGGSRADIWTSRCSSSLMSMPGHCWCSP